jgi:hypothetical protein
MLLHRFGVAHQSSLRSLRTMMTYANTTAFQPFPAGGTAVLLSTTTELLIIDLVSQHNPQTNTQLACHRHTRLPETLLHQLAAVETFQLRIAA